MHRMSESDAGPVKRLLYRWFVEYNPLYLLSAVLVLLGLFLMARGLTNDSSLWGNLGVGIVTELYSAALIAGAALLTRIGSRRPAVCVAFIALLYQGDLILSTEMYPLLLPRVGATASMAWWVVFVAKLYALAWALELRFSLSAVAGPAIGAVGLAAIPYFARTLDSHAFTAVVAIWLFAVFAAALWTSRRVTSRVALDAWGDAVLRRSTRAASILWGCLVLGHVFFWIVQYDVEGAALVPVAVLLATRWLERERSVLAVVVATLVLTAACVPHLFPLSAMMSAVVFALHAVRKPSAPRAEPRGGHGDAYRGAYPDETRPPREPTFELAPRNARVRLLTWAGYALYLAAWTASWSGGAWPAHVIALDVVISVAVALFVWNHRQWIVSWPLAASYVHWAIQSRFVRMPQSTVSWGVTTVSVGFGLLLVSLFTSWRIQRSSRPAVASSNEPA
jgi:hypothetical protein